ncbi:MAG: hypothetical protein WC068_15915 [Caulobacter sp.]
MTGQNGGASTSILAPSQDDRAVLREASDGIGGALIAINMVEHALDLALTNYFELQEASLTLLPMMDFRAKMTVIQRDELLCNILDKPTRNRMHRLYDKRNVIAHGHVRLATGGEILASGERYEVHYPRNDETLHPNDVSAIHSEAVVLLGLVCEAVKEINDIVRPLKALTAKYPGMSVQEIIERMRRLAEEG